MILEIDDQEFKKNYSFENSKNRIVHLQPFQDRFIFSTARYPAMIAAWGTGKTMCAIEKAKILSEKYPNNLGVIFRKEYTDLRDSTLKDFESYTGLKVDSSRECKYGKSLIMFRHLEEMNNIQNLNLGWFVIEQAEELDSDDIFFKLHGRLRRAGVDHFGAIIGNTNGHNWIYKLWKAKQQHDYELIEAKTIDNEKNLPRKFIDDLERLKESKPKLYNRFVFNSWDEENTEKKCINPDHIKAAQSRILSILDIPIRRIVGIDVARKGDDKTVMYALENGNILGHIEYEKKDTMEVVGYALKFANDHKKIKCFAVDELNAGAGVCDRLKELGFHVIEVNSASKATQPKYKNIRAEVYGWGAEEFENGNISLLGVKDDNLIEQLTWSDWKKIDSTGVLQVEPKEDIIDRYGRSPDNADAYLYALWGLKFTRPVYVDETKSVEGWKGKAFVPARSY